MSRQPKSEVKPKKKDTKISSADDLTKSSKSGDIELDEEGLKQVSGGKHVSNIKWTPGST